MFFLNQNLDSQKVPVTLMDNSGNLLTGISAPTIELSKEGASFASPSDGTFAEIGNGDYTVTLNEDDTDTLGLLILRVKDATSAETKVFCHVCIGASEFVGISTRIRRIFRQEDR